MELVSQRSEELKSLIRDNDVNRASRRLLDYAKEFAEGTKFVNESILLRAEFNHIYENIRKFGNNDENTKQKFQLIDKILRLVDDIKHDYGDTGTGSEQITTALKEVRSGQQEKSNNQTTQRTTSFANAKTKFKKNRAIFVEAESSKNTVFECFNLRKTLKSGSVLFELSDISIKLNKGEIIGVIAENGNGKTTLLKIIAGQLSVDEGILQYPFLASDRLDWFRRKRQIAYVPQNLSRWHGTLQDNLSLSAANHGVTGKENDDEVEFILNRFGLEKYRYAKWEEISAGYQLRFELAKNLVWNPKLLIIDEPLANLDINTQLLFLQDLKDLAASSNNSFSVLLSSQHLYELEHVADKILFLKDGKARFFGQIGDLGKDRKENSFEISCTLSRHQLYKTLDEPKVINVEDTGSTLIINTTVECSINQILQKLIEKGVQINYFRDISKSIRNFFR